MEFVFSLDPENKNFCPTPGLLIAQAGIGAYDADCGDNWVPGITWEFVQPELPPWPTPEPVTLPPPSTTTTATTVVDDCFTDFNYEQSNSGGLDRKLYVDTNLAGV